MSRLNKFKCWLLGHYWETNKKNILETLCARCGKKSLFGFRKNQCRLKNR